MNYVNLLTNDVWSELDIVNRGRAVVASQVSEARQNDLRTIMLGHIAGMRTATPSEMGEIMQVRDLVEQSALDSATARIDMTLLAQVIAYEAQLAGTEDYPEPSLEVLALHALRHPFPNVDLVNEEVL